MSDSDIEAAAQAAISTLLPTKSKHLYEAAYQKFDQWCMLKNIKMVTEKVVLAYFAQKMENQKASTTWTQYSMLRATLNMNKNIDIGKFTNLIAFLKRKSDGYKPKKSKIFTKHQIDTFLKEANDEKYLLAKVVLIIGIFGACRQDELVKMTISDIEDIGGCIKVSVSESKTKNSRLFVVTEGNVQGVNMLEIVRKYVNLRPQSVNRFFVGLRKGKCIAQPVGINTMGSFPKIIAEFLGLSNSDPYTGHCFRRSSASLLADSGINTSILKRHGGWKSSSVAEGYVENSLENKKQIATKILGGQATSEITTSVEKDCVENDLTVVHNNCASTSAEVFNSSVNHSLLPVQFSNLTNCTIKVYNK